MRLPYVQSAILYTHVIESIKILAKDFTRIISITLCVFWWDDMMILHVGYTVSPNIATDPAEEHSTAEKDLCASIII